MLAGAERGQQLATSAAAASHVNGGSDGDFSDDNELPPLQMDEPFWGMEDYAYDMDSMRGRFGRSMRHEASKQVREIYSGVHKGSPFCLHQKNDAFCRLEKLRPVSWALARNLVVGILSTLDHNADQCYAFSQRKPAPRLTR